MEATRTENVKVDLHHLTRIEGHGNLVVELRDGQLERCQLQVVEAPRFFEAMLRGRPYHQAPHLASRICGICSVAHSTASILAVENALGIQPTLQTHRLRLLNFLGEMLDSHILHVYLLVAPDLFDQPSAVALAGSRPEVVLRALKMKKLAGDLCAAVGGRHTHPVALSVGGFTHHPGPEALAELRSRLVQMRPEAAATLELFQTLQFPDFQRETEYIALHQNGEYCLIGGGIGSSRGGRWPLTGYREVAAERVVTHSTAKHSLHRRGAYMVGALARLNLNFDRLHPAAQQAAEALGLRPLCTNPFHNTSAQVVEIVQCLEQAIELIDRLLATGLRPEPPVGPTALSGEGVGAVEAPRGTLYHHYQIEDGLLTSAHCIIPTAQNLANVEADMQALVSAYLQHDPTAIEQGLQMLVRAYDPCISCSVHRLEVKIVEGNTTEGHCPRR
jgi:coenzyme F420-reducing hydrogenase alpha subunit